MCSRNTGPTHYGGGTHSLKMWKMVAVDDIHVLRMLMLLRFMQNLDFGPISVQTETF
jgi:hypothetical protein